MKLTMEQLQKAWARKDSPYGVQIGNDLLICGKYAESVPPYIEREEINETCDYSEDSYYLIIGINGYSYGSIREVSNIQDLALRYFYN